MDHGQDIPGAVCDATQKKNNKKQTLFFVELVPVVPIFASMSQRGKEAGQAGTSAA